MTGKIIKWRRSDFDSYQETARKTAIYPDVDNNLWYPALGLAGEAGEVAEKVKKIYRDYGGEVSSSVRHDICMELGDALWYIANIACELHVSLRDIAYSNITKLQSRTGRDKIHGEGDKR
jgi:NTP pyrophosphatase (non-canonical NTP hydrolase)